MSLYFVDTSALAKRYISEIGSAWTDNWITASSGNTILISQLAILEFYSLLNRRHREKKLSLSDLVAHRNNFNIHVKTEYLVVPLDQQVWQLSYELIFKHPLKTLDTLQLACAIRSRQILGFFPRFVSADDRLLDIARLEGFPTENPHWYP